MTTIDNKQHRNSRALFFTQNKSINFTLEYNTKISTVKDNFKKQNLITEKTANSPKLKNQKMPKFHTSPKIYRQGNPERPVFNSISSHTSIISKFVDRYLQPYIRYIDDLLFTWKKTEEKLPSFIEELNKKQTPIKFDFKYTKKEIEFLDINLYKELTVGLIHNTNIGTMSLEVINTF